MNLVICIVTFWLLVSLDLFHHTDIIQINNFLKMWTWQEVGRIQTTTCTCILVLNPFKMMIVSYTLPKLPKNFVWSKQWCGNWKNNISSLGMHRCSDPARFLEKQDLLPGHVNTTLTDFCALSIFIIQAQPTLGLIRMLGKSQQWIDLWSIQNKKNY